MVTTGGNRHDTTAVDGTVEIRNFLQTRFEFERFLHDRVADVNAHQIVGADPVAG